MHKEIDILENETLEKYPNVFDILLRDPKTQRNILWVTNKYIFLSNLFKFVIILGIYGNAAKASIKRK